MQNLAPKLVRRGFKWQLLALSVLVAWFLVNPGLARSALIGAGIATLAHGWFVWRVFRQADTEPQQILGTVYRAEVGKLMLTVMLFIAAFVMIKPLHMVSLMAAYLFTTWIPWLASMQGTGRTGD